MSGTPAKNVSFGVSVTGCASPLPFSLSQSAQIQPPGNAGAKTSYTLNLERADGQQYLSQIKTTMPAGLVGLIPTVTQCAEPQASKGECPAASQIGVVASDGRLGADTVRVLRSRLPDRALQRRAVRTLDRGARRRRAVQPRQRCVTPRRRSTSIPYTARVTATSTLPTIVKGIPLRMKRLTVNINRQGFLVSPTNCGALATETTLTSTFGATQNLSSAVPGRQLQRTRVQAVVRGGDRRQDVQSQRGEPRNDAQHAGRRRERQIGARAAAQAAAVATDDAAESVPGSDVRRESLQLPVRLVRRAASGPTRRRSRRN